MAHNISGTLVIDEADGEIVFEKWDGSCVLIIKNSPVIPDALPKETLELDVEGCKYRQIK